MIVRVLVIPFSLEILMSEQYVNRKLEKKNTLRNAFLGKLYFSHV